MIASSLTEFGSGQSNLQDSLSESLLADQFPGGASNGVSSWGNEFSGWTYESWALDDLTALANEQRDKSIAGLAPPSFSLPERDDPEVNFVSVLDAVNLNGLQGNFDSRGVLGQSLIGVTPSEQTIKQEAGSETSSFANDSVWTVQPALDAPTASISRGYSVEPDPDLNLAALASESPIQISFSSDMPAPVDNIALTAELNAYSTSVYPYNTVVLIQTTNPNDPTHFLDGSGVIVGPHTIL